MANRDESWALEVVVDGPGIGQARISLSDLSDIANSIQKAVRQIGSVAKTGVGYAGGRLDSELEVATRLDLTGLEVGSAGLVLDFPDEVDRSFPSLDIGEIALNRLVDGIDDVNSGATLPEDWTDSVFRALDGVGRSLNRGRVETVKISRPGGRSTTYTTHTRDRIKAHLSSPLPLEFKRFTGRLMMVDFDIDRRRCRVELGNGDSVDCTFPVDLVGAIRENAMRFVDVEGYAEMATSGRVRSLSILRLSALRTPSGAVAEAPLRAIDELVRSQGIDPAGPGGLVDKGLWEDADEVEKFLAWVDGDRRGALL